MLYAIITTPDESNSLAREICGTPKMFSGVCRHREEEYPDRNSLKHRLIGDSCPGPVPGERDTLHPAGIL